MPSRHVLINVNSFQETFATIQAVRYSLVAAYCLQIYEWFASLHDELILIHNGAWSSVRVAYILCRYYPLTYWAALMWAYVFDHDPIFCSGVVRPVHALLSPFQFLSQAIMLMRTYAFSGRSHKVFIILSTAYVFLVGVDIWLFCTDVFPPSEEKFGPYLALVEGTGCFPDYSADLMGIRIGLAMLAAMLMDLLSLIIVLIFCFRRQNGRTPLGRYFLKQGLSSFALLTAVNIIGMCLYFQSHSPSSGIGLPFILVISNLLACR
ncbi:hypothetical protein BDQ12DRAFT_711808, partial [Crucibulum laeve]